MKKLFITSALLLSAMAFTTVQAKESKVAQAKGAIREIDCRRSAVFQAYFIDGDEVGTEAFQADYQRHYHDCMGN